MVVSQLTLAPGGPACSRMALGMWRLAEWRLSSPEILDLVHLCLDLGITTIDHADIYGDYSCEQQFGEAIARQPGLRQRLQLVSKCDIKLVSAKRPQHPIKHYDTSRIHILDSVENSLKQLRTDRLDLLLLHRPDPLMNADETAEALTALRQAGKVLHFGVSNFSPSQFELLASRLEFPLVTNQVEFSVVHLEPLYDGTFDQCQRLRVSPMAWSPFGGGQLFRGQTAPVQRVQSALQTVGQELGATIDQVALAWILRHPAAIVPLLGTGNPARLKTAAAAEQWSLSRQQWFAILEAATGTEVP